MHFSKFLLTCLSLKTNVLRHLQLVQSSLQLHRALGTLKVTYTFHQIPHLHFSCTVMVPSLNHQEAGESRWLQRDKLI